MKRFLFALAMTGCMNIAHAAIVLEGAQLLQQTSSGDYTGSIWSTTGCCALAHIGIGSTPGTATELPLSASHLSYAVPNGTTSFVIWGESGYSFSYLGVNLFFDTTSGAASPQIGVFGNPMGASGQQRTWDYFSGTVAAGGLSYTAGGETVTLSNFSFTNSSDGVPVYANFDLTIGSSSAPEPATLGVMGVALAAFGFLRRRKL